MSTTITMPERIARLDSAITEGRLIQFGWGRVEEDGRERVCLLAALSPEVAATGSAAACPSEVMPAWLADLTPWMDDEGSSKAWPGMVSRYASIARRWAVLDAAAWARAEALVRVVIVREAMRHTDNRAVWAACRSVIDAIEGRGELAAASAAASAFSESVAATCWETWGRLDSDAWAAYACAEQCLAVAAKAAKAAAWETALADAAWETADRITAAVLDAIEDEITRAECTK